MQASEPIRYRSRQPAAHATHACSTVDSVLVHEDELFVADMLNDRVQVFALQTARALRSARGRCLRVIGGSGRQPGRFKQPRSLVVHSGRLLVAEHSRVQVLSLKGVPLQCLPISGCVAICGPTTGLPERVAYVLALGANTVDQEMAREERAVQPGALHMISCDATHQTTRLDQRAQAQGIATLEEQVSRVAVLD